MRTLLTWVAPLRDGIPTPAESVAEPGTPLGSLLTRVATIVALLLPLTAAAQEPAPGTEDAPARATGAVPAGQPRYLEAMRTELTAMDVRGAECEAADALRAQCRFVTRGITTEREFTVHAIYSDRTDTIYLYIERFLVVPADGATTNAVLRRLMELNWDILLGKLEWDSTDGEVRLGMVVNTDSNFDRRAFRSAVRGIGQLADRYYGELDRLLRGRAPAAPAE